MSMLNDTLEKRALVKEAVEILEMVTESVADSDAALVVFQEVMTNIRGVSMRRARK